MRGALGAGDNVLAGDGEAEVAQVRGNFVGAARGVVGDKQLAAAHLVQRLHRALGGLAATEHRAVQVYQQAIIFLRNGFHLVQSRHLTRPRYVSQAR